MAYFLTDSQNQRFVKNLAQNPNLEIQSHIKMEFWLRNVIQDGTENKDKG